MKTSNKCTGFGLLLTMVIVVGLLYQYMYVDLHRQPVATITTVTQKRAGQIFTETEFKVVPYDFSSLYFPRYPVRACDSNMTYIDFGDSFTTEQNARVNACISTYGKEVKLGYEQEKVKRDLRWSSHSYLNTSSFMIEAGGHNGVDVEQFNSRFHPGTYVVLEPVSKFYNVLRRKFQTSPNVLVYKLGIDAADGVFYVNDKRNDAASIFFKNQDSKSISNACKIVNVTKFFDTMSVRSRDVDLITMNCEGCEYAVLDRLLSTDYIRHFRNIQFQPHRISGICHPIKRFCWYQELLQKTHKLTFQFKFVWESWRRI